MPWIIYIENAEGLQKELFFATADLLNLEVDLLFFDTTSTYFEVDGEDNSGIKRYGYSKDKRSDLPQIVIGLAVTKEGIPVRCWVLAGNTQDMTTVEMVKAEDVALGYKQLMEVERAFRTLKTALELRPIYHRKDERIKSHKLLDDSIIVRNVV